MGILEIFLIVGLFGFGVQTAHDYNQHKPVPQFRPLEPHRQTAPAAR